MCKSSTIQLKCHKTILEIIALVGHFFVIVACLKCDINVFNNTKINLINCSTADKFFYCRYYKKVTQHKYYCLIFLVGIVENLIMTGLEPFLCDQSCYETIPKRFLEIALSVKKENRCYIHHRK